VPRRKSRHDIATNQDIRKRTATAAIERTITIIAHVDSAGTGAAAAAVTVIEPATSASRPFAVVSTVPGVPPSSESERRIEDERGRRSVSFA